MSKRYCQPEVLLKNGQPISKAADEEWNDVYDFWHNIVVSPTEEIFEELLSKFKFNTLQEIPRALGYIKSYWLEPYKEIIVKAWASAFWQFGHLEVAA